MTPDLTQIEAMLSKATRQGWTPDQFGNICIGMKPLFKRTGGTNIDAALIVALVNAAPALIAAGRDAERMREALAYYGNTFCEGRCDGGPCFDAIAFDCAGCVARAALTKETDDAK